MAVHNLFMYDVYILVVI